MGGDVVITVPLLQQKAAEEEEQTTSQKPEPQVTEVNGDDLYAALPLPPNSRCIRVLDLDAPPQPQSQLDNDGIPPKLSGRLRVVNLADSPPFTALSYVWGASLPSPSPYRISISLPPSTVHSSSQQEEQTYELDLTPNCHSALHHILSQFSSSSGLTIWVDALCINQSTHPSNNEKAVQIPLMEEIYMLASCVYVWLGEGDDESDKIMRYIKMRACLFRRLPLGVAAAVSAEEREKRERELGERQWADFDREFS